jgi:hypothetical protein
MAARIDLNPARAGMVEDPEDFLRGGRRWGKEREWEIWQKKNWSEQTSSVGE